MTLEIKLCVTDEDKKIAFSLRRKVFIEEQGIDESLDFDGKDGEANHIISLVSNNPVGVARVRFIDDKAKLERIATLKKYRGKGYGEKMMKYLVEYCKTKKVSEIYFDSQKHAKIFYEKLGFKQRGEEFEEAGIPHVEMYLQMKK